MEKPKQILKQVLESLNTPSKKLQLSAIQDVLEKVKQYSHCRCCYQQYPCSYIEIDQAIWEQIAEKLWDHLCAGLKTFDDQLLCATAFYAVLSLTESSIKKCYLEKVQGFVQSELERREAGEKEHTETAIVIAFVYGIFQSAFLTPNETQMKLYRETYSLDIVDSVLINMTKLLLTMAYDYSKYTYIVFKTMASFEKILGHLAQLSIFVDNTTTFLDVINHNWENPITGVRDLNKKIYYTLISQWEVRIWEKVNDYKQMNPVNECYQKYPYEPPSRWYFVHNHNEQLRQFCWNKAKYLMYAENLKASKFWFRFSKEWCPAAIQSLSKPGLVAAGADMYYAALENTQTFEEWSEIFLQPIHVYVLNGSSEKAVQAWTDYWCLPTLKKYPMLLDELLKKMGDLGATDQKLFSGLCLLKQGNKLGLFKKNWSSTNENSLEKYILSALEHRNANIRMLAFDIVCVSPGKVTPTIEYGLVIDYLHYNINSDCRVLRISMLKSVTCFLTSLHSYFLSSRKDVKNNKETLFDFCTKFQELILRSLNMNGNYQRRITCVALVDVFLKSLGQIQRKRQEQPKQPEDNLVDTLERNGRLIFKDATFVQTLLSLTDNAADDVRENVVKLLLEYYIVQIKEATVLNDLIKGALRSLSSKFFYEISCGHTQLKLITNILAKQEITGAVFKSVEDVFDFGFTNLISEFESNRGIVESIEEGKQLHSYIGLLQTVLEMCVEKRCQIKVPNEKLKELLVVLKGVSNQFAWEQDDTSSDFSRMNEMVQELINASGSKSLEADETKLSSLHQLVLNCLWLNVKASCELSATLIQFGADDEISSAALQVIIRVLDTCRHKGAIEAAGVALGKAIRHLTSLPESHPQSALPLSLLQSKLQELTMSNSAMASVTRRGAGLSIMLHRIVASDDNKDKPLFHYFARTILEACKNTKHEVQESNETATEKEIHDTKAEKESQDTEAAKESQNTEAGKESHDSNADRESQDTEAGVEIQDTDSGKEIQDIKADKESQDTESEKEYTKSEKESHNTKAENSTEAEKDMPIAIYIHFLTRIVTDSSLTCEVMYYSADLAEVAFGNLTSSHWQIRNAALQLYGALLPKLIGQKKPAADTEPVATVACDELRTHSPRLWKHMMDALHAPAPTDLLKHHANLVPVLNVLANCAPRYNFNLLCLKPDLDKANSKLFESLMPFVKSPIFTVRKLAAKAICNILDIKEDNNLRLISNQIVHGKSAWKDENTLNGCLILVENFIKIFNYYPYGFFSIHQVFFNYIYAEKISQISGYPNPYNEYSISYVNKLQFLKVFPVSDESNADVVDTLRELIQRHYAPGVNAWAIKSLELRIPNMPWDHIPDLIQETFKTSAVSQNNVNFEFDWEEYLEIILTRLTQSEDIPKEVMIKITQQLLTSPKQIRSCMTWKILYEISKRIEPQESSICVQTVILTLATDWDVPYMLRYFIPFAAAVGPCTKNEAVLVRLSNIIASWTDPKTDPDLRNVAVLAVNELAKQFQILPEQIKVATIKSAAILLQDEDEDIRNASIDFYKSLTRKTSPHPYMCLLKILNFQYLDTILTKKGIENLCNELSGLISDLSQYKSKDDYNPFANDSANIYLEPAHLKMLVENIKQFI